MRSIYKKNKTKEISFPLGGIGSGCIGLGGDGRLKDWEIFNRPNKGSVNGLSHFAIKAENDHSVLDARLLHGDLAPPYIGDFIGKDKGFGFGPRLESLAGVPHFLTTEFTGEFPFSVVRFIDETFPGTVSLQAFNPFIPLDDLNSSLPAAFFEVNITNSTDVDLTYTIALTVTNPDDTNNALHECKQERDATLIRLGTRNMNPDDLKYGALAFGTIADDEQMVGYQQYWYRGQWFDSLNVFWRNFTTPGLLKNRVYDNENWTAKAESATLEQRILLAPGETGALRFIISWYFPNCYNYWSDKTCDCNQASDCNDTPITWKNYYATIFDGAEDVCLYGLNNWESLKERTMRFKEALFSTTIPDEALEAISANLSTLKSPTVMRLSDGSLYGFEGCNQSSGCCEGSCSHVWNYAYALPYLYPALERTMRDLEFAHNQRDDGKLSFRLMLPIGTQEWDFRACVDGQFGTVLKVYREWKISGDDSWLDRLWPSVKKAINFAWAATNEDRWDLTQSGVVSGRQHHTLDMELFGPNSWLNGLYLAALKAAAEIANYLGDYTAAELYLKIFHQGKKWTDQELFNGSYYFQKVDLKDKSILDTYYSPHDKIHRGGDIYDAYWNYENDELKFQIAEGCAVDQVIAQWHANLIGLGEIFDQKQTVSALKSIYKNNYIRSFRQFFNPCRTFALNDEAGTVICSWPENSYKPHIPVPYAEEAMNGFEYQVACHMIQEGLIEEGLEIVRSVRERYDGEKRNPWNEFECGSNYARSMASYALLLTFSGFSCDMSQGILRFNPIFCGADTFVSFWSVASGWGTIDINERRVLLLLEEGNLSLSKIVLSVLRKSQYSSISKITRDGRVSIDYKVDDDAVVFPHSLELSSGESIEIS